MIISRFRANHRKYAMSIRKFENSDDETCTSPLKQLKTETKPITICLDESGRGCQFSRVYVGAVILPENFKVPSHIKITDSKKMKDHQRETAFEWIIENVREYKIGWADEVMIDKVNITAATMRAFHNCLDNVTIRFDKIIMDGSYWKSYTRPGETEPVPCETMPKADLLEIGVSCASILAKVSRDRFIRNLCEQYPDLDKRYGILGNFGYPRPDHAEGIAKYGLSQFHRKTYKPCMNRPVNPVKIHSPFMFDIDD